MLEELLEQKRRQIAPHFKPGFLQREMTVFQFDFKDEEPFYLEVGLDHFNFFPGRFDSPTVTLHVRDHETCWGLLEGSIDGMQAFMSGDYRADGHIVLSQLLLYLFKPNDPTLIYEVQD